MQYSGKNFESITNSITKRIFIAFVVETSKLFFWLETVHSCTIEEKKPQSFQQEKLRKTNLNSRKIIQFQKHNQNEIQVKCKH